MILLLILAVGAVCHADKLDRTYLPPPGSQYAGGSPDAILPPIELPKGSSYSTTAPTSQNTEYQGLPHHGRPGLHQEEINRNVNFATDAPTRFGSPTTNDQFSQVPTDYNSHPGVTNQPGLIRTQGPTTSLPPSIYRNGYPTTSTSYAFAQTTTYSPVEEQGCVGQNCGFTSSGPGLVDSGIEPQISISQHTPEHIANVPNNQFGLTERPLQIQQQVYPQQYQYTSSSQAPTNLLTQPGGQSQYSTESSQNIPKTILPQNNYGSSLNARLPNLHSQQGPTTSQQNNIDYQPTFPSQSVDNLQTNGAFPQYSMTDFQKVNQQVNTPSSSTGQPGYFNQRDQLSGDRSRNRFDAAQPQENLPISHSTASSTGIRPSSDPRLTNAVYRSSTPFPITSQSSLPSFKDGIISNNNGISDAESRRQMSTHPLNNNTRISSSSHRLNDEFDRNAYIVNYENVITPEGFAYSYDTSNGIHADENGTAYDGVKAQGSYSYTGDDGKVYTIVYTADENGFQPRGDHLPTPPPIPEAILRVIEEANRSKAAGIIDDGMYDEEKYGYQKYEGAMDRLKSRHMKKPTLSKPAIEIDDKNDEYEENVSVEKDQFENVQSTMPHKVNDFTRGKPPMKPMSHRHEQIPQDERYLNENIPNSSFAGKNKLNSLIYNNNAKIKTTSPSETSNVNFESGQENYDYDSNPIEGSIGNINDKITKTENIAPIGSGRRPITTSKISKTKKTQNIYDDGASNTFDSQRLQQGNDDQYTNRQPIGPGHLPTENVLRGSGRRPIHPSKTSETQKTQSKPTTYGASDTFEQQGNGDHFTSRQPIGPGHLSTENVPRGPERRPIHPSKTYETQMTLSEPTTYGASNSNSFEEQDSNDQFTTRQPIGPNNVLRGSGKSPVHPVKNTIIQNTQSETTTYDDGDLNTFDPQHIQQGKSQYSTRQQIGPDYVSTEKSIVRGHTRRPTTVSSRLPTNINQKDHVQKDYDEYIPERINHYQDSNTDLSNDESNLNKPTNEGQIKYGPTSIEKQPGTHIPKITNNYEFDSSVQSSTRKPSIRIQGYDEKTNGYKYLPPSNQFDQLSSTVLPTGTPVTTSKHFITKTGSTRRPFTTPGVTQTEVDDDYDVDYDNHVTSTTKKPHSKYSNQNILIPQEQFEQEQTTENEESLTNIGVNSNKPQYTKYDYDHKNRKPVYNLRPQFPMRFQTNHPEQNAASSTMKPVYHPSSVTSHSTIQPPTQRVNYYPSDASNQNTRGPEYQPSTTYRPHSFAPSYAQSTETPYRQIDNSVHPGSPTNNRITQSTPRPQYDTTQSGDISEFPDRQSTFGGNKLEYTEQYDSPRGTQSSNLPNSDRKFTQGNTRNPETFDDRLNVEGPKSENRGQFSTTQTPEFGTRVTKPYRVQTDATPSSRITPSFTTQRTTLGNIENKNIYLPGLPSNAYDRPASTHNGIQGEDFSGPKQQPKFDPETGYHY